MFQYKCIRNQIWLCRKKGKVNPDSSFMHTLIGPSIPNATYQVPKMFQYNALEIKFDLDVKKVKVNLWSSVEQTW